MSVLFSFVFCGGSGGGGGWVRGGDCSYLCQNLRASVTELEKENN